MDPCCYKVVLPKPKPIFIRATLSKEKLDNMRNIIIKLVTNQTMSDLTKLFDEGALISRMCCKIKKKFRGEKLFRRLKQISVSIKKLHQINIAEVVSVLLSTFENGMPTKQAGQWAGTRILAAIYLINQLQQFSEGVAQLIVKVFQNGQCWLEMNIALAMVSRVWILTKSLSRSFKRSYQQFRPLVNQLKKSDTEWLPDIELPENVKDDSFDSQENSFSETEEELVETSGSVMRRKPEIEGPIIVKKRKRPGKHIRMLKKNTITKKNCKKTKYN